jgi:hypothetical protein
MHEHLANSSRQASALDPEGLWNHRAMVDCGQVRRRGRWSPDEFLEHSNMEHIMKTRTRRQFQADSDVVDQFGDAVGPTKRGLSFPVAERGREVATLWRRHRNAQSPTW